MEGDSGLSKMYAFHLKTEGLGDWSGVKLPLCPRSLPSPHLEFPREWLGAWLRSGVPPRIPQGRLGAWSGVEPHLESTSEGSGGVVRGKRSRVVL